MLLGIASDLSAPPSSPSSFREVCFVAKVRRGFDVVAYCPDWERDSYAKWFKVYGLFDYVDDIIPREQLGDLAIEIEGGQGSRLTAHNIAYVLHLILGGHH